MTDKAIPMYKVLGKEKEWEWTNNHTNYPTSCFTYLPLQLGAISLNQTIRVTKINRETSLIKFQFRNSKNFKTDIFYTLYIYYIYILEAFLELL